ncbi:glycosyltransferase [Corynebacterium falsenii]|uniref:glycosyltransferase n=1 Tax=Corynebacterium falsenii TaxID=108486 RepID=UPI00234C76ED|nr:glycosyltransferase [Corynebacterium falsenii]MDC7104158.1 glycosyltransferase [Corynebacterium falsenii]
MSDTPASAFVDNERQRPVNHVLVGPDEHGVTEYGLRLADALSELAGGQSVPVHRFATWQDLRDAVDGGWRPGRPSDPGDPVHVTFTDHLLGADPQAAVELVDKLAESRSLSVSVHDVPQPQEGTARCQRRAAAYVRLAERADVLWVNSEHEARFFREECRSQGRRAVDPQIVPLPLPATLTDATDTAGKRGGSGVASDVTVMGFIYPGKGHAELIDALAGAGVRVRALGALAAGHAELGEQLTQAAERGGLDLEISGYLPEADLERAMRAADVPVCPHRHFSASGSLMKWVALGRRVLVADSDYARELAELWPEFIVTVRDDQWAQAIAELPQGFSEPLEPPTNWTWQDVARAYQRTWLRRIGGVISRQGVAENAADRECAEPPLVSVIVPYYNNPIDLERLVRALDQQDYPGDIECIVADDGSDTPPPIPGDLGFPVRVVRQEDRGFRAAAARNLGAQHARGSVLAFLDGDTIPLPSYLTHAVAGPATDPRVVTIGTRLHGDGTEPTWLADAWKSTDDLHATDDSLWRFVISAVLTCSAELFDRVGGFDGSIVGYGGEDWDFGWRCWNAGALFHHATAAIADHDAHDWAGRATSAEAACEEKNRETVALAPRISHPLARPAGVVFTVPDVLVILPAACAASNADVTWPVGACESVIAGWLSLPDVHILSPRTPGATALFAADPRVHFFSSDATSQPSHTDPAGEWMGARLRVHLAAPAIPQSLEDVTGVDNLGGHVRLIAPAGSEEREERGEPVVLAEVDSARYRATRAPGDGQDAVPMPPRKMPGLVRDVHVSEQWEIISEPQRLERRFAGW